MTYRENDCIVIGSGPNGLSAAIALQACGFKTLIIERHPIPGGGLRSDEEMGSGFVRDVCSAVHPMAMVSPFFQLLDAKGLLPEWIYPDIPCAHPLAHGESVALHSSLAETVDQFRPVGAKRYRRLLERFISAIDALAGDVLKPLFHVPKHPLLLARFGARAIWPANIIGRYLLDDRAAALFAGMAAHSFLPFHKPLSSAVGLILLIAGHARGWPFARNGSGQIARSLIKVFQGLGGTIETGREISDIRELPSTCALFFDTAPRALVRMAASALPQRYVAALERYRYGPGAYKIDYILSEPIPWSAKDCRRSGTVHLGGPLEDIKNAEAITWRGQSAGRPFMIVAQPSLFDRDRSPDHREIVWSYAHVPHGAHEQMDGPMEAHIESYAPGFRDCIVAKKISSPTDLEGNNPNLIGGDIVGGISNLWQTIARPVLSINPYRTPNPRIYLCSASTPPGGGIHGMCGVFAAQAFVQMQRGKTGVLFKLGEALEQLSGKLNTSF